VLNLFLNSSLFNLNEQAVIGKSLEDHMFQRSKNAIQLRLRLLKAFTKNTFQAESAYWQNNWANMISVLLYTASFLVFIEVIFANINTLGGYSKEEAVFFYFIAEFFVFLGFTRWNFAQFSRDVNSGQLDMLLTKPVPSLFFIMFRNIPLLSFSRDMLPTIGLLVWYIDWSVLDISVLSVLGGVFLLLCGLIIQHFFAFLASLPAIIKGESQELFGFMYEFEDLGQKVPFEAFPKAFQFGFLFLVPITVGAGVATSVFLNKGSEWLLLVVPLVMIVLVGLELFIWKRVLRLYSSASS